MLTPSMMMMMVMSFLAWLLKGPFITYVTYVLAPLKSVIYELFMGNHVPIYISYTWRRDKGM